MTSMLAALMARIGGSTLLKAIPWRVVIAGALALGVSFAGYRIYRHVVDLSAQLAVAQLALDAQTKLNAKLKADHKLALENIAELEASRAASDAANDALEAQIRDLNLEKEMERDPDKAADLLRARARQLNRMLEESSRGRHPR